MSNYTEESGDGDSSIVFVDPEEKAEYRRFFGEYPPAQPSDIIDKAPHYNQGKIEAIDVIEDWDLGFHLGNTVKYICRAKLKGKELEDLKKAQYYLNRYIGRLSDGK